MRKSTLRGSALAEERRQWESQRDEASTSHSTEAEQLAARQAELDAQRRALEAQQTAWETQESEIAEGQAATKPNCSGCARSWNPRGSALAEERRQWESQRERSLDFAFRGSRTTCGPAGRIGGPASGVGRAAGRLGNAEVGNCRRPGGHESRTERLRGEVDSARIGWPRNAASGNCSDEALTAHSAEAEQLAARQAELDAQRQALDEQQAAWETQKSEIAEGQAAHKAELGRLRAEVESARSALAEERGSGSRSATKP